MAKTLRNETAAHLDMARGAQSLRIGATFRNPAPVRALRREASALPMFATLAAAVVSFALFLI